MTASPTVLVLPGLGGSGPGHWQTLWEGRYGYERVEQSDWDHPVLADWLDRLEGAVRSQPGDVVLVAHSLACPLVAHWARGSSPRVRGALLVAPADVDSERHTPPETRGFSPIPLDRPLPFASVVVASRNDPYVDFARATFFAERWGSELVDLGCRGHINADSGLDDWPLGHRQVERLLARARSR